MRKTRGQRLAGQIVESFMDNTPGVSAQPWAIIEVEIAEAIDRAIKRAVAAESKRLRATDWGRP